MGITLVQSSLKDEEENCFGWDKQTVAYVLSNPSKVKATISSNAKGKNKILNHEEVEEVYMELINYLYTCEDYNLAKATESKSGKIIDVSGYVNSCIKFCVLRHITELIKDESRKISGVVEDENGEHNIYDILPTYDKEAEDIENNIGDVCRSLECYRYKYKIDLYQMWYIKLNLIKAGRESDEEYINAIMSIIGISRAQLREIADRVEEDEPMIYMAKAVTLCGIDRAIEEIKGYVYAVDRINRMLNIM